MARNMGIWAGVLLLGIVIIIFFPLLRGEVPPDQAQGMGSFIIIPFGYFLALIGAGGLIVAWIRGRAK